MSPVPNELLKEDWVFAFAMELVRVRRRMTYGEAETRAKNEWQSRARLDPRQAARRWLGEQASGAQGP